MPENRRFSYLVITFALLSGCGSETAQTSSHGAGGSGGSGGSQSSSGGSGGSGGSESGGATSSAGSGGSSTGGFASTTSTFVPPTALAGSKQEIASSLALGPTDVYWASLTVGGPGQGVKKAPKEPGADAYLASDTWPYAIAVDEAFVYWATQSQIVKKPLGGGAPVILTDKANVIQGASIAIDATRVYWANHDSGTVMSVAKDGSALTKLATGQSSPLRVVVDDENVYWTNTADPGAIMSVPKAGGAPVVLVDQQPFPQALAVDGTNVYWGNGGGDTGVMKAPKGGGPAVELSYSENPMSIAVDAKNIYWLHADIGVVRMPLDGGKPVPLSVGQTGCSEIALDDDHVYWTRNAVIDGPKVLKLAK